MIKLRGPLRLYGGLVQNNFLINLILLVRCCIIEFKLFSSKVITANLLFNQVNLQILQFEYVDKISNAGRKSSKNALYETLVETVRFSIMMLKTSLKKCNISRLTKSFNTNKNARYAEVTI